MTWRAVWRSAVLTLLPAVALAQGAAPGPSAWGLLALEPRVFQAYVAGIYEGQAMLAAALKAPQIVCVDPEVNRRELALIVRRGIARLPGRELQRSARVIVFRVLIEQAPCPGFRWEGRDGE